MAWANDDVFEFDVEREFVTPEDVPVYGFGELPDAASNQVPIVTIESPAPNTTIGKFAPLVFTIVDPDGDELVLQEIHVQTGGSGGPWFVAWREGAAMPGFSVLRTPITNGYRFEITRLEGWLDGGLAMEPVFADPYGGISGN